MIFDDNTYTAQMASVASNVIKAADKKNQVALIVGDNMIFGDVDQSPEEFDKDTIDPNDSILFHSIKVAISERHKNIEETLSSDDQNKLEPVYIFLRNVVIRSLTSGTNNHVSELAVRVSSIDAITAGIVPSNQ